MKYHTPVLLRESLEGLNIRKDGIYVDATYGGGGHAGGILEQLGAEGRLVVFDLDPEALMNKIDDERVIMINQNFKYMSNFLNLFRLIPVDGILADLGVSSHQIDNPERGFSTRFDGPLDFRMGTGVKSTARKVLNEYPVARLTRVFRMYGELSNASRIAETIEHARSQKSLESTAELKAILLPLAGKGRENKFLAQVFQAIRIEVNDELEALKSLLTQSVRLIRDGGRLAVIAYHSLEDTLVKRFIRSGNFEGEVLKDFYGNALSPFALVNRKPITPAHEEVARNNRARSAKLRIAEKRSTV